MKCFEVTACHHERITRGLTLVTEDQFVPCVHVKEPDFTVQSHFKLRGREGDDTIVLPLAPPLAEKCSVASFDGLFPPPARLFRCEVEKRDRHWLVPEMEATRNDALVLVTACAWKPISRQRNLVNPILVPCASVGTVTTFIQHKATCRERLGEWTYGTFLIQMTRDSKCKFDLAWAKATLELDKEGTLILSEAGKVKASETW